MTTINVNGSNSMAASNCVELPAEMKAQKLCVIYLFFRQWTGTATMRQADYLVGKDGFLPPAEVTANYGQKRVIDPAHLRVFDTLKKRAEALLADHGLPFCKGVVLPVDKAPEVLERLREIADEYNAKRDDFVAKLDERCREWIRNNARFADQLRAAAPVAADVAGRINADFAVFRFQPAGEEIDKTGSLERSVDGLFGEVIEDVVKRSRTLHRRSVLGKSPEDMTQRTLSTLKTMRDKLLGLRFLSNKVDPLIKLLERLLHLMPTRGKFSSDQFNALNASLALLSDESLLLKVSFGQITLDDYIARALPETLIFQNTKTATVSVAGAAVKVRQVQTKESGSEEKGISKPNEPSTKETQAVQETVPPAVSVVPEEKIEVAAPVQNAAEIETNSVPQEIELDELLQSFFDDATCSVEETVIAPEADAKSVEGETQTVSSDEEDVMDPVVEEAPIPPEPKAMQLSSF